MVLMRNLLLLGVGLLIACWVDENFFGGYYNRPIVKMLREIATGFR